MRLKGRPLIIGIGGTHSGAGKTTIGVAILKHLTTHPPIYPFTRLPKIGAIKYTKTAFYASIIDDLTILRQENKDTRRLIDAGAEEVLWVQSPRNELQEVLPIAVNRLSHLDVIIIEGNSAIEFLKPDIVVFITGVSSGNIKPSAHKIQKQADIIIENNDKLVVTGNKLKNYELIAQDLKPEPLLVTRYSLPNLINCIEMTAKKKDIENILKERSAEGITCSDARKIAEELGVPYKEVGKIANELKIKIKDCELGCF